VLSEQINGIVVIIMTMIFDWSQITRPSTPTLALTWLQGGLHCRQRMG